jgi:hypothetical protein
MVSCREIETKRTSLNLYADWIIIMKEWFPCLLLKASSPQHAEPKNVIADGCHDLKTFNTLALV